jgi:hypothetical protein
MSRLTDFLALFIIVSLGLFVAFVCLGACWVFLALAYLGAMIHMPLLYQAFCLGSAAVSLVALWHLLRLAWNAARETWRREPAI